MILTSFLSVTFLVVVRFFIYLYISNSNILKSILEIYKYIKNLTTTRKVTLKKLVKIIIKCQILKLFSKCSLIGSTYQKTINAVFKSWKRRLEIYKYEKNHTTIRKVTLKKLVKISLKMEHTYILFIISLDRLNISKYYKCSFKEQET